MCRYIYYIIYIYTSSAVVAVWSGKIAKLFFFSSFSTSFLFFRSFYYFSAAKGNKNADGEHHPLFIVRSTIYIIWRGGGDVSFSKCTLVYTSTCARECMCFVSIKKQMRTVCWMINRLRYCSGEHPLCLHVNYIYNRRRPYTHTNTHTHERIYAIIGKRCTQDIKGRMS